MNPTLLKNLAVIFIYSPFGPTHVSLIHFVISQPIYFQESLRNQTNTQPDFYEPNVRPIKQDFPVHFLQNHLKRQLADNKPMRSDVINALNLPQTRVGCYRVWQQNISRINLSSSRINIKSSKFNISRSRIKKTV